MDGLSGWEVAPLSAYRPGTQRQFAITFDDGYENVYRHAFPVLKERKYPFAVFVNGDLLGKWNRFDTVEPLTRFCGLNQLREMAAGGGTIHWHGRSHVDLTKLDADGVAGEMRIPERLRQLFSAPHLTWFAYPYGAHTPAIVDLARSHFAGAVSVEAGANGDRYQLNRLVVTEHTTIGDLASCAGYSPAGHRAATP
jgi:peptidoglycan/xylan/chitin deacetylase (PgdA/CDA1 family)